MDRVSTERMCADREFQVEGADTCRLCPVLLAYLRAHPPSQVASSAGSQRSRRRRQCQYGRMEHPGSDGQDDPTDQGPASCISSQM